MRLGARALALAAAVYVGAAARGLAKETRGDLRCTCEPECWCKKPGLRLFRWVFPFRHSLRD